MKSMLLVLTIMAATLAPLFAEDTSPLDGTWSGTWTPKEGVADGVTVELKLDSAGKLTGKFLSPARLDFSKATFVSKTKAISLEAADPKSGKRYRFDATVQGSELKGVFATDEVKGDLRLVKWTYKP